ncbi:MraY family glycosyltransferase [Lysobacter tyrosinilyticus]
MLIWLLLHFTIGLMGTWMARQYALRRELIDHPGERRSHHVPTPRGGGLSIVIALLVATCVAAWHSPQQIVLIAGFGLGLLLVAGIGMVDDHRPLSPWLRLGVQAFAATVFALAVAGAWGDPLAAILAFIAVMVLTNIWNFMDGINGIAASQAAVVAVGLAMLLGGIWGWMALALAAACLGFLPFNFPKARVFMGDVGSGALGFALAGLLVVAWKRSDVPMPLLLLPLTPFLVDSTLTLLRRLLRRERWWTAHAQHAYQRWAFRLGNHTPVTLAYAGWSVAGWLLSWWLAARTERAMVTGCAIWLAAAALLWALLQYFPVNESSIEKDRK